MWHGLALNTCGIDVSKMQIKYMKTSCKKNVHTCGINFIKEMKQNLHETTSSWLMCRK
jgi:hypothetical protein